MIIFGTYLICLMIAPQLWVPGLKGLPVDWILFSLWFFALVLRGRAHQLFRFDLPEKLFVAFLVWMVVGMLVNGLTDASKDYLYVYVRIFVLYKAVSASVTTPAEVRRALAFFVLLAAILAVEAIDHKSSPDLLGWAGQRLAWIDPSALKVGGTGRASWVGIFDGPGVFCVIFTIALAVCMPYLSGANPLSTRLLLLPVIILLGFATYLTGSRGGLLATLAVIGLFIAVVGKTSVRKIVTAGVICVVLFMLAPPWMTSIRDESKSAQHRVEMWAEGLEMIKQNPLFGIGRGNFASYTSRLVAHNSAIEIGGETGLPGLLLWVMLIYVSLKAALLTWVNGPAPAQSNVGLGLMLALAGYVISAMFVTLEYETFYLLLALCAVLSRQQSAAQSLRKYEVAMVFGIIGGWLAFMQIFVIVYMS